MYVFIYFVRKSIRSESLQSIIGNRAVETSEGQFIGNDGVRIRLEKMDCLLEKIKHQHKSEHRYSTLATAAMDN